jgi:predicted aminopeptidase
MRKLFRKHDCGDCDHCKAKEIYDAMQERTRSSFKEKAQAQARVMALLLTGGVFSARKLSILAEVSSPRKEISYLRSRGVVIGDMKFPNPIKGCTPYKGYFIEKADMEQAKNWRAMEAGSRAVILDE